MTGNPKLWLRLARLLALVGVMGISIVAYSNGPPPAWLMIAVIMLVGIGVASQVYRYRKVSGAMERQQTKWVMLALVFI